MPHHAEWTRSTKANNAVLINGQGQVIRDFTATGEITDFVHRDRLSYTAGDAKKAYKGLFEQCDRHVVFVRPGLFAILDDLKGVEPSTYQWLLHSMEPMEIDPGRQRVISRRDGAWLEVQLFNSLEENLDFSLKDTFDIPYMQGVPTEYADVLTDYWHEAYQRDIEPQYHFQAGTGQKTQSVRIAALMLAGSQEGKPELTIRNETGWCVAEALYPEGKAAVWVRLDPDAEIPVALNLWKDSVTEKTCIAGLWIPEKGGPVEILTGRGKGQH
jgi:hypothetical protein